MNTHGFTLVELLAVIIILSLLALLTSTSVTKLLKDSKEDLSDVQIKSIRAAAETWGADNIAILPDAGDCKYLTLKDLKEYGVLDGEIKDPVTNKIIPDDLKIKITSKTSSYGTNILNYEVDPQDITGCKMVYKPISIGDQITYLDTTWHVIDIEKNEVILYSDSSYGKNGFYKASDYSDGADLKPDNIGDLYSSSFVEGMISDFESKYGITPTVLTEDQMSLLGCELTGVPNSGSGGGYLPNGGECNDGFTKFPWLNESSSISATAIIMNDGKYSGYSSETFFYQPCTTAPAYYTYRPVISVDRTKISLTMQN